LFLSKTQIDLVKQDVWGMTQQFLDARRRNDWFCNREIALRYLGHVHIVGIAKAIIAKNSNAKCLRCQ